ncbi:Hsp70 family protein [Actinomycetospora aeridis]|uniref:Hsp70 family protein n=1 Tax=Actinomycetospora aeridis TaxID=3129231 RepID=A0ABU8N6M2_9PSEU
MTGEEQPFVGLDFGTSTSAIAWYDPASGRVEVIPNAENEAKTPSLVQFGDDEVVVGEPVERDLAEAARETDPAARAEIVDRIVSSVKRRLVAPPLIPLPGRAPVTPTDVVSQVLGKLKRDAEEGHFNRPIDRAVVTCPAVSGQKEREVLRTAATRAGFAQVELLEEPVAAAMAFHHLGQQVGETVLVYDLGAGTFDLSVVRRDEDGRYLTPVKPEGDARCGGDDFDQALYEHCDEVAIRELGRSIGMRGEIDPAVLRECRERKHNLSIRQKAKVSSRLPSLDGERVLFAHELDRGEFEELVRSWVEQTVRATLDMVERCASRGYEIDTVVMIGGATQVPIVEKMLADKLPIPPRKFANRDHAVALGAALRAWELWGAPLSDRAPEEDQGEVRYREALEGSWADGRLTWSEATWLRELASEIGIDDTRRQRLEQDVLGVGIDEALRHQRAALEGRYDAIVRLYGDDQVRAMVRSIPRHRLDLLLGSSMLFGTRDFPDCPVPAAQRAEIAASAPWPAFVIAARLAADVDPAAAGAFDRIRAVSDDLGLSPAEAAAIEVAVHGRRLDGYLEQKSRAKTVTRATNQVAQTVSSSTPMSRERTRQVFAAMAEEAGASWGCQPYPILEPRLRYGEVPLAAVDCCHTTMRMLSLLVLTSERFLWSERKGSRTRTSEVQYGSKQHGFYFVDQVPLKDVKVVHVNNARIEIERKDGTKFRFHAWNEAKRRPFLDLVNKQVTMRTSA